MATSPRPLTAFRLAGFGGPARMLADVEHGETAAEEAAEPPVVAEPRIGRQAFLYMEPRQGIDGAVMFSECGSCQHMIPEAFMFGAVQGNRCSLLGSQFPITDDDHCGLYSPWSAGVPCVHIQQMNAGEVRKGVPPAVMPYVAGYKSKCTVQCQTCRFFDGPDECEAYEMLNEQVPQMFDLDKTVKPNGKCSLWTPHPDENI